MIIQEITDLAEKLYLTMEAGEFRELLPGIPLAASGKKDLSMDNDAVLDNRLIGSHRILDEHGDDGHCFITFEFGKLAFYEINAQFDNNETNYGMLSGLFNALCPVLAKKYHQGKLIHPLKDFREFSLMQLPVDGYPCDRYVIGAMRQWEDGGKNVALSFALVHPGYLFFQLRAILLP